MVFSITTDSLDVAMGIFNDSTFYAQSKPITGANVTNFSLSFLTQTNKLYYLFPSSRNDIWELGTKTTFRAPLS